MSVDIYQDELQNVWLFGQSVLYTEQPIPQEQVPKGWYCYDLGGTAAHPDRPYELVNHADQNFAGSILSDVPLMRGRTQSKLVPDNFWLNAIPVTLSCFVNQEQKMGVTKDWFQQLQDAANPNIPHSYDWYVLEGYNTPEEQFTEGLTLEEAIQRYTTSEYENKRLGVSKDNITALDLLIRHDGREWVSESWTKDESFSEDPVVAEAIPLLRKTLDEQTASQGFTMGGPSL